MSKKKSGTKKAGGAPPRLDAANLAGYTTLMNPQHLRPGISYEEAERSVMGKVGGAVHARETDPVKLYNKELSDLADELGLPFLDDENHSEGSPGDSAPDNPPQLHNKRPQTPRIEPKKKSVHVPVGAVDDLLEELKISSSTSDTSSSDEFDDTDDESDDTDDESDESDNGSDDTSDDTSDDDADSVISNLERDLGIDVDEAARKSKRRRKAHAVDVGNFSKKTTKNLTEEQQRRRHINSIMGEMRRDTRTSYGLEHERIQDIKEHKLEQIGNLRALLVEDGVDCDGIGTPTMASTVEEINSVLNILKLKNDRNRYSSMAEEVILSIAEGIETVLDGTREIPILGWKPDYTGYHNTVNVKLHRMRYETSQVVGSIIEKYNFGSGARIVMELLPSFLLYPRQRRRQRGVPGLDSDLRTQNVADAHSAYAEIRRSELPQINNDAGRDGVAKILEL